ncbi:MAG: 3-deoxy-manno-octulosonate cytidylyltransferase [Planctomycetota bacterium]
MALIVIPARLASERLPRKPLLAETGRALVVHTWESASKATRADRVVVATDDEEIATAVRDAGGEAVMTSVDCPSGTDRVAEAARAMAGNDASEDDVIINVQGDEPEMDPAFLDALVAAFDDAPDVSMATLAAPLEDAALSDAPSVVKVVTDNRGNALYFSRSRIPFDRDGAGGSPLQHIGVYGYRRSFLERMASLEPTPLERTERLEQLRVLEHGESIRVVRVAHSLPGIDTPEEYASFVSRFRASAGDAGPSSNKETP